VKKYIQKTTQKNKSIEITSIMETPNIDYSQYRKLAYIEIGIYFLIAMYFIQKYLLKYYIKEVKDNKAALQKNPSYIAKSAIAGTPPTDAFNNTIINSFTNAFGGLKGSFSNIFGSMNKIFANQSNSLNGIRNIMKPMRDFIGNATGFFYKMIEKFTITIMYTFHRLRQIFRRSLSGFNLVFHALENTKNLLQSVLYSSELEFIFKSADFFKFLIGAGETLCFDKDTIINTMYDSQKIKDIECGDILNHNYVITKIESLNNEYLYKIRTNNQDIYVSGSHIIYDTDNNEWCCVKDYTNAEITNYKPERLYSLSTSNHRINIGDNVFLDYEEISNDRKACLKINYEIMSHLNKHISFVDNLYHIQYAKNMDSGFLGNSQIRMNDNTYKNIKDIQINDLLSGNNKVIGVVKICANSFIWYDWNGIICTDNCKFYINNICFPVNHPSNKTYTDDLLGYNLITESSEMLIKSYDCEKDYRFVDFIQVKDHNIRKNISDIALKYMNKK
jgi:hypothetical protein